MKTQTAEMVRFGQTLFVLAHDKRTATKSISKQDAERTAYARFAFDGPAVRSNASFASALKSASMMVRRLVTQ